MQSYQLNWSSAVVSLRQEHDKVPSLEYLPSGERGTCIYSRRRWQHVIPTKVAAILSDKTGPSLFLTHKLPHSR